MKYDRQRSPAEIEAEIARVRRSMDATLTAIEGRLTTSELVDQGIDYLRHSGGREFVANLGTSVKQNPLSVTLVGIGLAWLMFSGRRGGYGAASVSDNPGLAERAGDALSRVAETVGSTRDSAMRSAHAVSDKWAHAASAMRDRARHAARGGRQQAERARQGFDYMLREQPLALGAIGLAVGAIVAAAAPRTRQEDEWMGEASDRIGEQAKDLAGEQLEKARQMVSETTHATAEESRQPVPAPGS